jgi:methylenetetrahydrofolate--tRNA-(uracil-5-)-methyltransferase
MAFALGVTEAIKSSPLVTIVEEEVTDLNTLHGTIIVASGPLTSPALSANIQKLIQADYLHFFDAAAPIVTADSLDFSKVFKASRYDKGEAAYLNCPFYTKEEYVAFREALVHAEMAPCA